jgi:adenine-specific DNA-methyltransferase
MRFIGKKDKLLDKIYQVVKSTKIKDGVFCDFFAGTASVGNFFKQKGFKIISSDLLFFSYVLQEAYIKNNTQPKFTKLLKNIGYDKENKLFLTPLEKVIKHLNNLAGKKGFIYRNYTEEETKELSVPRKYFTPKNGMKIDAIRSQIEKWKKDKKITNREYFILLACLIESVPFYANISGVYAAFLKEYDPRALKDFKLRPIKINKSNKKHTVYNKNSMDLIKKLDVDILYIDPPYNNRQYASNYHLLETIAKYDNPVIKGVSGVRNYDNQKSEFCNEISALTSLDKIAELAKYKYLILSYNSEGIMSQKKIINTLKKYGDVELKEVDYRRFRSNSNGEAKHKKNIKEQIYLLIRK